MKFFLRAFYKFRIILPKFYFGKNVSELLLDHIEPVIYYDKWDIQPFNGQAQRLKTILTIARIFDATEVIETGTFMGSSTPYLASLASNKTYTIEIDKRNVYLANRRFKKNHTDLNIDLINGDSAVEIKNILKKIDPEVSRIIAYLDAHWLADIPTSLELSALDEWGGAWVAIIDDFKIENDLGFGFDEYNGTIIGKGIIPDIKEVSIFVPSHKSSLETGRRKGTGYIFNKKSQLLVRPEEFVELKQIFN